MKKCRFCDTKLQHSFVDLGSAPPCQSQLTSEELLEPESFYPLHAMVCSQCYLVQLDTDLECSDIFSEYAYFSSFSKSWVKHAENYVEKVTNRFGFDANSKVMEVASNDGYLLQHFIHRGIPCLGIEPAANVAQKAIEKGIDTEVEFLGEASARRIVEKHGHANLVVGNNVLAHVPNLNDFIQGLKILLAPDGILTMEFPHLLKLMQERQFDTIYHEHYSYFSFTTVCQIFATHGLRVFDVDSLSTHGGSIRIYACHQDNHSFLESLAADSLQETEMAAGFRNIETYKHFNQDVMHVKYEALQFLAEQKLQGKHIVGYGAAGKGNTFLNYCGIRSEFIDYLVDRNPYKQNHFAPGSRIPIHSPEHILETKPDFVVILPWNLSKEIREQMAEIHQWGGQFVVFIPGVKVIN